MLKQCELIVRVLRSQLVHLYAQGEIRASGLSHQEAPGYLHNHDRVDGVTYSHVVVELKPICV